MGGVKKAEKDVLMTEAQFLQSAEEEEEEEQCLSKDEAQTWWNECWFCKCLFFTLCSIFGQYCRATSHNEILEGVQHELL